MTDIDAFKAPANVDLLRQRIRAMDEGNRSAMVAEAGSRSLPSLADTDGNTVDIPRADYGEWECLIASFEQPLDVVRRDDVLALIANLLPGERLHVWRRLANEILAVPVDDERGLVGVWTLLHPLMFTAGRDATIRQIVAETVTQSRQTVADVLGVLPPLGDIITTPVADAAALAEAVDWVSLDVAGVIAAVGTDPGRASAALVAEYLRPKPRAGVIKKIEPLALVAAAEPDAGHPPAVSSGSPSGEQVGQAPETPPTGESSGSTSPSPVPSDGVVQSARHMQTPPSSVDSEGVAGLLLSPAAPSAPTSLAKYAAMLGRLGSEMVALSKLIANDLQRVDL